MTSNEKSIITALRSGKRVDIELKSGCVLKNVIGRDFADVLMKTLNPDQHFNVYNAVASYACTLLKDGMSLNGLEPGDFPKEDFQMFGALFAEYTAGMVSAMNHASGVNWYHFTEVYSEKIHGLCNEYLEKGYCTYRKI